MPAPSTPTLEKLVKQLSVLLWVPFVLLPLNLITAMLRPGLQFPGGVLTGFLIVLLVGVGIWAVFTRDLSIWLKALLGHRTPAIFDQTAKRLIQFMNFSLVIGGLGILGSVLGFGMAMIGGAMPGKPIGIANYLTFLQYFFSLVTVYTVRTWFRLGYSPAPIRQRPVLLWSLYLTAVLSVLEVANSLFTATAADNNLWAVVLQIISAAVVSWSYVMGAQLVQATFGVSDLPPFGPSQIEGV